MKDIEVQENTRTMATTTLSRLPIVSFAPTLGFGTVPNSLHTDWGPGQSRNQDEIMAAYAIAQLSRSRTNSAGIEVQPVPTNLGGLPLTRSSLYSLSGGITLNNEVKDVDVNTDIKSVQNHCDDKKDNVLQSLVIKSESSDEYEKKDFKLSNSVKMHIKSENNSCHEGRMNSERSAEGGQYVRTCQPADFGKKRWDSQCAVPTEQFRLSVSPSFPSSRSFPSFTNSDRKRILSPHRTQNKASTSEFRTVDPYSHGRSTQLELGGYLSGFKGPDVLNLMTPTTSDFVPKISLNGGRLDRFSVSPKSSRKLDNSGSKYRLSPYNIAEPVSSSRKHTPDVKSQQGYDSPTGYLRRRAQHTIELARWRYPSDDGGLVRNRIMEGNFGSLSAIEAYIRQHDRTGLSRLPLDDSAIDLSLRNRVNNRLLADEDITIRRPTSANILQHTYDSNGRETPELTVAFKQCDLKSTKPAGAIISHDTLSPLLLTGLKPCRSEPYSLCDLGNTPRDILCVPGTTVPISNNQKTITLHKSADNINSGLFSEQCASDPKERKLTTENANVTENEERRLREDVVSRKSRSPTFHLPDNQLPPKKRRMFGQSWTDDSLLELNKTDRQSIIANSNSVKGQEVVGLADSVHVFESLLSAVRPDEDGDLPLHIAVVQGRISTIERLINLMRKLNISIDSCNNQKQTALHLAVITNQLEAIELLLDSSSSPHLADRHGNGLLHLAVKHNSVAALRTILGRCGPSETSAQENPAPIDLNKRNFEGMTPLQMGVQCGNYEAVKLLLGAGADVNAQEGKNGRTALYFAAERNDRRITRLLTENGADATLASYSGCTPAQAASGLNHLEIVQILDAHGVLNR